MSIKLYKKGKGVTLHYQKLNYAMKSKYKEKRCWRCVNSNCLSHISTSFDKDTTLSGPFPENNHIEYNMLEMWIEKCEYRRLLDKYQSCLSEYIAWKQVWILSKINCYFFLIFFYVSLYSFSILCILRVDLNLCFLKLFSIFCLLVLCHLGVHRKFLVLFDTSFWQFSCKSHYWSSEKLYFQFLSIWADILSLHVLRNSFDSWKILKIAKKSSSIFAKINITYLNNCKNNFLCLNIQFFWEWQIFMG